jgi:hypothetical protein
MNTKDEKGSSMKNLKILFGRKNTVNSSFVLLWAAAAFCLLLSSQGFGRVIDLKGQWNDHIPLENPHKGWYHHFPDNGINKYIIAKDTDLTEFPGMDHLYIRLAWSYLEPQEGQFNWDIIDQMIEKWTAHNLGISFRISCKETSANRIEQQYATPRWVMEAGAKGGYKETQQPLLYNIEQYPSEKYDLASKYPDIIKKIQTIIAEHQLTL